MNAARSPKKASKQKPKPAASKATKSVTPKATPTKKVAARPVQAAKAAGEKGKVKTAAGAFSLAPILAAIRKRVSGASAQAETQTFAEAFYKRMEEDEYPHHSADGWAAIAADTLAFARNRKPGTANVRIFNASQKSHGWESPHTVLQIINDDMPFLVDSVSMALAEMGVGVHVLGHPLVRFARDKAGKVQAVGEGKPESLMLLEIDRLPPDEMAAIEKRIRAVLEEVRAIVRDWSAMREKMLSLADDMATRRMPVDDDGRREAQEFMRWAAADHFTFFGYREYRVEKGTGILAAVEDSGLGL
ncbi:MAG TPA: NAD-glutamate dehydrogenase, partial [Pseudoxanthomonas sp.]|nr:NAD-glutamate dehydrogenase [Pseudoxanthomonas sp.]